MRHRTLKRIGGSACAFPPYFSCRPIDCIRAFTKDTPLYQRRCDKSFGRFFGRFSHRKHNIISVMNYNLGRFTFLPIFFCIIVKMPYVYGVHNTENCKKSDFSPFENTKMPCNELVLNLFASVYRNNKL